MICKNCNQELPEQAETCPNCSTPCQEPVTAPKKLKPLQWGLIILCGLIVLAALTYGALSLAGVDLFGEQGSSGEGQHKEQNSQTDEPNDEPEGDENNTSGVENTSGDKNTDSENTGSGDIQDNTAYTAEEALLVENSRNVVASMGGKELTVGELQMHYQSAFYTFYSQNYYYLSYLGLDLEKPLDEQYLPASEGEDPMTWQQYFVEAAVDNWRSYVLLELMAEADGYRMDPELQAALDDMETSIQQMAAAYGYESADEWLRQEVGVGVTAADYARYNQAYYLGSSYLNNFYQVNVPSLEEIEAYYQENEAVFVQNGITKDMGLNAAVRHILIMPEDTESETSWAAAKAEAELILQEWKDGDATEERFAEMAGIYTDDGGSQTTGGLYEDVNADSNFVVNFKNWAIDASRLPGDTGIVETEFGYHIMYFVSGEEYWVTLVGEQLIAERVQAKMEEYMQLYPMEIIQENILVGQIQL